MMIKIESVDFKSLFFVSIESTRIKYMTVNSMGIEIETLKVTSLKYFFMLHTNFQGR